MATSTLPSPGPHKMAELLRYPWILPTPSAQRKSELATLPLPSQGPKTRRYGYVTPAFLGVPNVKRVEKIRIGCLSPAPKRGWYCYATLAFPGVPNAKHAEQIKSGDLTRAFSGACKRAALLRDPCILGGPQRQARGENQKWLPPPCLLGNPKKRGIAT